MIGDTGASAVAKSDGKNDLPRTAQRIMLDGADRVNSHPVYAQDVQIMVKDIESSIDGSNKVSSGNIVNLLTTRDESVRGLIKKFRTDLFMQNVLNICTQSNLSP